jgi:hypothetical protein
LLLPCTSSSSRTANASPNKKIPPIAGRATESEGQRAHAFRVSLAFLTVRT